MKISVTDHALDRHIERAGNIDRHTLAQQIRAKVRGQLYKGIKLDRGGAAHVPLGGNRSAIVKPSHRGGWEVITILCDGEGVR